MKSVYLVNVLAVLCQTTGLEFLIIWARSLSLVGPGVAGLFTCGWRKRTARSVWRHFGPRTLCIHDISAPSDWCRSYV